MRGREREREGEGDSKMGKERGRERETVKLRKKMNINEKSRLYTIDSTNFHSYLLAFSLIHTFFSHTYLFLSYIAVLSGLIVCTSLSIVYLSPHFTQRSECKTLK